MAAITIAETSVPSLSDFKKDINYLKNMGWD